MTLKEYWGGKLTLNGKAFIFLENCYFFWKLLKIPNICKILFKCFLTVSKHGEVIEHKVGNQEPALENNVKISWGLRLQIFKNIVHHYTLIE